MDIHIYYLYSIYYNRNRGGAVCTVAFSRILRFDHELRLVSTWSFYKCSSGFFSFFSSPNNSAVGELA